MVFIADSNITKRAFAAAMKELMDQKPFEKISISDICQSCDMNRKSFYYHFKDKYDLVNWIYDIEFITAAGGSFGDPWEYLEKLCGYFDDNRTFYRHALKIEGQNSFSEYFREMLEPVVSIVVGGIITEPRYKEFQTAFYSDAFVGAIERWLFKPEGDTPEDFVEMLRSCIPS